MVGRADDHDRPPPALRPDPRDRLRLSPRAERRGMEADHLERQRLVRADPVRLGPAWVEAVGDDEHLRHSPAHQGQALVEPARPASREHDHRVRVLRRVLARPDEQETGRERNKQNKREHSDIELGRGEVGPAGQSPEQERQAPVGEQQPHRPAQDSEQHQP